MLYAEYAPRPMSCITLKTTLKVEINEDAWATLHSAKPATGRIAVKVINHLGMR